MKMKEYVIYVYHHYQKKTLVLDCLHEYHIDCIDELLCSSESCPHCRSNQEDAVLLLNQ